MNDGDTITAVEPGGAFSVRFLSVDTAESCLLNFPKYPATQEVILFDLFLNFKNT